MSNNSSVADTSSSDDGSNVDKTEFTLAIAAFVISLVALIIASLQALQQYFASAAGYSYCGSSVIGQWSKFRQRRMRWDQFRFEVLFDVPVIFVAPPTNTRGPLGSTEEKKITYMDGSHESYRDSHTWSQEAFDSVLKQAKGSDTQQSIHTAENELASWLGLLMAIQRMEKESREWEETEFFHYKAPQAVSKSVHTLTVAMQQKRRSWDSMPDSLKKPYAHTTISHMVEIAAMLGIYWREFNRNDNTYRAQGNGFILVGSSVDDLGVGFTFQKVGPTWFQENRVVPNDKVKELCFGFCPTIFRAQGDKSYRYTDEPKDKGTLQLGSRAEIAETLVVFGCNTSTANYFRQDGARHSHLFPVPFEMLGMVGVVLQIETTAFCMLPNPTIYNWDKASFSLRRLASRYREALLTSGLTERPRVAAILKAAEQLELLYLNRDARAADGAPQPESEKKMKVDKPDLPELMATLHATIRDCDQFLTDTEILPLVLPVVQVHFQEVLKVLNTESPEEVDVTAATATGAIKADSHKSAPADPLARVVVQVTPVTVDEAEAIDKPPTIADLDLAGAGGRHRLFINLYVSWIRPSVMRTVANELRGEQTYVRRGTAISETAVRAHLSSLNSTDTKEPEVNEDNTALELRVSDIWCTLVFRMFCWLLLHDFHKKDVQISKSDVFGSREPVYIL